MAIHLIDKQTILEAVKKKVIKAKFDRSIHARGASKGFDNNLAAQAKQFGVVHLGWGRYGPPGKGKVTYVAHEGKLEKVPTSGEYTEKTRHLQFDDIIPYDDIKELSGPKAEKYNKQITQQYRDKYKNEMTVPERRNIRNMISNYQKDGFKQVNDALRKEKEPVSKKAKENLVKKIKAMEKIFTHPALKLDHDEIFYYGVSKMQLNTGIYQDKGYRSVTTDFDTANEFVSGNASSGKDHMIELHVKKGKKALSVNAIHDSFKNSKTDDINNAYDNEHEFILDKNSKIRVHPNPIKHGDIMVWKAELV